MPQWLERDVGLEHRRLHHQFFERLERAGELSGQLLALFVVGHRAREHKAREKDAGGEHDAHLAELDDTGETK